MLIKDRHFYGDKILGAREYQEDTQEFLTLKRNEEEKVEILLAVLADGMGGEKAGDIASQSVVKFFVEFCENFDISKISKNHKGICRMLRSAMRVANEDLIIQIEDDPSLEGMGCTLLATVVIENLLFWVSVGDSPLYLYRKNELIQINEDHSMLPILKQLVKDGKMTPEECDKHPYRNLLRAAISGHDIELVHCPPAGIALEAGDIIIVASDGLQTLKEDQILDILNEYNELSARVLVQKLLSAVENAKNPQQDNTAVNVIRIPREEKILFMNKE